MQNTLDLLELGREILPSTFHGVVSRDALPMNPSHKELLLIINTDTSNLPGQHWVAFIVRRGVGFYFDPMGYPPPLMVTNWIQYNYDKWSSNMRRVQMANSTNCGYFCLHFLYFASRPHLYEQSYKRVIEVLYPSAYKPIIYEQALANFFNLSI